MANDYDETAVKEIVDRERGVLLVQIETMTKIAAVREKLLAGCSVTRNAIMPVAAAVLTAFEARPDACLDDDLDDEQSINFNVQLTLGDVRRMRRFLP